MAQVFSLKGPSSATEAPHPLKPGTAIRTSWSMHFPDFPTARVESGYRISCKYFRSTKSACSGSAEFGRVGLRRCTLHSITFHYVPLHPLHSIPIHSIKYYIYIYMYMDIYGYIWIYIYIYIIYIYIYIFIYTVYPLMPPKIPMAGPMLRMGSVQPSPIPRRRGWWFSGCTIGIWNKLQVTGSKKFMMFMHVDGCWWMFMDVYGCLFAWWFGTCFIFHFICGIILPIDELHHFSEG